MDKSKKCLKDFYEGSYEKNSAQQITDHMQFVGLIQVLPAVRTKLSNYQRKKELITRHTQLLKVDIFRGLFIQKLSLHIF